MSYWERQRVRVLAAFSALLFVVLALPAIASYNVFYANTNFDTQFGPQYGQKILVTPVFYSNSLAPLQPHMYSCGLSTDTYPAGFWISNMLSGRYLFTVQAVPHPTPRIFVIPDGTGNYTLSTADVVATPVGTGFPSYADITNYVNAHAGSLGASYISNSFGVGTNTTLFDRATTDTNSFHAYGAGDPLANGVYFIAGHFAASQLTVYTNENKSGYAMAYAGPVNVGGCSVDNFAIYSSTNGNPCNSDWPPIYYTSATNVAWTVGQFGVAPAPTFAGWGQFYPAITVAGSVIGNGGGLTNINAAANNLTPINGLSGTLSNKFIHIRDTSGITINNTNWIQSGGVSGGMATITNGGTTVYSTNGAFANVKMFDQLLFQTATPSPVQVLALVVSPNAVFGFQLNLPEPSVFGGTATYTSNWFLIPAMFGATDYTVGGENRMMKMDANNSLHFVGIGNQGVVAFHHHQNGTMSGMGIGTSALAGLQMGPNGVYYEIFGAGSNFVNGAQFVLPAETLREAMVFLTNGMIDMQYGETNRAGLPKKFYVPILPMAGIYGGVITNNATGLNINGQLTATTIANTAGGGIQGTFSGNGSALTSVVAGVSLTLSNGSLNTNISFDLNGSQYVRMFGPSGGDGYIWHWFSDRLELSNHVSLSWIRFNDGIQLGSGGGAGTTTINLNRSTGDINATTFTGSGASLTSLPSQTNSDTALLSRNPQTWTGSNHIAGAFEGSGILITNLNASQLATGTVPKAVEGSITNHSDVKITGTAPTIRDMLIWDGTNWTNAPSMGYTIDLFDSGSSSMSANTTYYYGKMSARLINTTYGIAQIDIPRAGRITRVQYKDDISGTLGSGEVVNFWIEVNNATDVFNWQFAMTAAFTNNVVTGSQAVAVGDTIVFKVTTPATWATPAGSVRLVAQVYIEP